MAESGSQWQKKDLATAYLEGVRGAIPGTDLQLAVLGKIVSNWCPHPIRLLDIGCGDGILGRYLLDIFPTADGLFVDFSDPMLEAARKKLSGVSRAGVVKSDFSASAWLETIAGHAPFDAVVSGFAIHHQPDSRKKELYTEIYHLLSPGGVFLNLEHVSSLSSSGEDLFEDFFIDHLYRFHRETDSNKTRQQVAETFYHRPDKKENILASVDTQCEWLREIGFCDVDCFFKVFELALFGGRKASNKPVAGDAKQRA